MNSLLQGNTLIIEFLPIPLPATTTTLYFEGIKLSELIMRKIRVKEMRNI